jgi:pilus assembly protein Flp/PilA
VARTLSQILLDDSGQGLAEYGLVLSLVSVAALAALLVLGSGVVGFFTNINADI